ncbi:MAG TPA: hypothetical protein VK453_12220 [Micromonosporaceae bacterium]|nr:hypothetical protein [Micromonosporaceae bacterium]
MREELNESFGHLRMAASHAATGTAGALAPKVDAARAAVKPGLRKVRGTATTGASGFLSSTKNTKRQAKDLARKSNNTVTKKESAMSARRWPVLLGGLMVAGVAAGAVGALVKRRRAKRSWDEYDSTRATGDSKAIRDSAKSTVDAGIGRASSAAAAAKDRSSDLIGSTGGPQGDPLSRDSSLSSSTLSSSSSRAGEFKQQNDDMFAKPSPSATGPSGTSSKNIRP